MRLFAPIYTRHAGILTVTRMPRDSEAWVQPILRLLEGGESLSGRLLLWHAERSEWREDAWRPDD